MPYLRISWNSVMGFIQNITPVIYRSKKEAHKEFDDIIEITQEELDDGWMEIIKQYHIIERILTERKLQRKKT